MIQFKKVVRYIAKKARSNRYRWKKRFGEGGDAQTHDYIRCYCEAKGRCEYCATKISFFKAQFDHIYSRAKGGDNSADNLALCCKECNERKARKHPAQFAAEQRGRGYWTPLIARLLKEYGNDPGVQLALSESAHNQSKRSETAKPFIAHFYGGEQPINLLERTPHTTRIC